jgi:hypothetical protein
MGPTVRELARRARFGGSGRTGGLHGQVGPLAASPGAAGGSSPTVALDPELTALDPTDANGEERAS